MKNAEEINRIYETQSQNKKKWAPTIKAAWKSTLAPLQKTLRKETTLGSQTAIKERNASQERSQIVVVISPT